MFVNTRNRHVYCFIFKLKTISVSTYMHSGYRHGLGVKEVKTEDKVIMIELQSVTPLPAASSAHPDRSN